MNPTSTPAANRTYTNVALTVIAGLLAVIVVDRVTPSAASAQPATVRNVPGAVTVVDQAPVETSGGLANAIEQRKQMITELHSISQRLDRIESVMRTGLSVKVTDMPPVKIQEPK